jgi:hypothetical protein
MLRHPTTLRRGSSAPERSPEWGRRGSYADFADQLLERPAFGAQIGNSLQVLPEFDQSGAQGRAVHDPRVEISNERK